MDSADDIPDTRIFVSGLPPNFTSNQLGAHFAGRYQVTDAVVIPDRRIGFVGFRNYTLAKSAIKYFDKSYIRMSKISVQMAKAVEIRPTSNSQRIPVSKHSIQGRPTGKTTPESFLSNRGPASNSKSHRAPALEAYPPGVASKKRKREPSSERQHEPSEPSVQATPVGKKCENDKRRSSAYEQGSGQLETARIRDEEDRQQKIEKEEDTYEIGRHQGISVVLESRGKKELNIDAQGSVDELVAAPASQDLTKSPIGGEKKGKKKKGELERRNSEPQAVEMDIRNAQEEKARIHHEQHVNEMTDSDPQVADAKGGVVPFAHDSLEPPEPSADQSTQQRRRVDVGSDNEWLRKKTSRVLDLLDEAPENVKFTIAENQETSMEIAATPCMQNTERPAISSSNLSSGSTGNSLPTSGRLFVRNLPYTATESDIEALFSRYGHLDEVHLVRDKAGSSKGFGYVTFSDNELSKHALQELDGRSFQGRLLHVLEAADRNSHKLDEYEISKLPLKKQKSLLRKRDVHGSNFNWNSMYMNPNSVLSSVADRLGVRKSDLIDASSSDAAVKQAHAETHIIQETKTFLALNGVNLDAFKSTERDERTLLVKNFPFGTTPEELKSLFGPYGEMMKCLFPPSGTTAIIQFAQVGDGRQAMRHLAYRNFKGSVLYLEKAPTNLFGRNDQSPSEMISPGKTLTADQEAPGWDKAEAFSSSTLFVRNLNFTTTTSGLADAFRPLSGFLSAKVKTKIDPRRPREVLSMGFGFVEFRSAEQARAALGAMNHQFLDDHQLLVQMSRKAKDAAEEQRSIDNLRKAEAHRTKIIIKNLPFEATKKDVRALLNAYGQLRSVKVPQKFDRSTRGFAFANFVTAKEAENAMEALKDTHLLGRRLVFEFAEEESIDPEEEIRAIESKVGRQIETIRLNKMTGSARRKFNAGTQDDGQLSM